MHILSHLSVLWNWDTFYNCCGWGNLRHGCHRLHTCERGYSPWEHDCDPLPFQSTNRLRKECESWLQLDNLPSDLSGKIKKHQHQTCHSLEKSLETIAEHSLKPCSTTHALDGTGDNSTWNVTDDDDFATRSYSEALGCEGEEVLEISIYFTFTFLCWYYIKCNTIKIYV